MEVFIGIVFSTILFILFYLAWWKLFKWSVHPLFMRLDNVPNKYKSNTKAKKNIFGQHSHKVMIEEVKRYGYNNINGPSVIRVPEWVDRPLGKYYMYFAHHQGDFIRLAYADDPFGPWSYSVQSPLNLKDSGFQVSKGKTSHFRDLLRYMSLTEAIAIAAIARKTKKDVINNPIPKHRSSVYNKPHIASPEILVDHEEKQIRMYYHGIINGTIQMSRVALSGDGISFRSFEGLTGLPYMRVFIHQKIFYGISMPGILYRSRDGLSGFRARRRWLFDTDVRHSALLKKGNDLYIFYTRVGDRPERILCSHIDLTPLNWNSWRASKPWEVERPTEEWEGVDEILEKSRRGQAGKMVRQLRDPYVLEDDENKLYLFYSAGGEQSLGITTLYPTKLAAEDNIN